MENDIVVSAPIAMTNQEKRVAEEETKICNKQMGTSRLVMECSSFATPPPRPQEGQSETVILKNEVQVPGPQGFAILKQIRDQQWQAHRELMVRPVARDSIPDHQAMRPQGLLVNDQRDFQPPLQRTVVNANAHSPNNPYLSTSTSRLSNSAPTNPRSKQSKQAIKKRPFKHAGNSSNPCEQIGAESLSTRASSNLASSASPIFSLKSNRRGIRSAKGKPNTARDVQAPGSIICSGGAIPIIDLTGESSDSSSLESSSAKAQTRLNVSARMLIPPLRRSLSPEKKSEAVASQTRSPSRGKALKVDVPLHPTLAGQAASSLNPERAGQTSSPRKSRDSIQQDS
ncbi:hypothetical protein GOP47_0020931 [Adiantum capillus-veneris]|uniref:Uncharacterized protein n=1 Tax=Adiantum capillus-veneris TaxID=13818 RepID=A0A9D4UBZ7_ADICA|nr:hypothetical protein GOP47_0020931 [Adiantum capillus-veneris]